MGKKRRKLSTQSDDWETKSNYSTKTTTNKKSRKRSDDNMSLKMNRSNKSNAKSPKNGKYKDKDKTPKLKKKDSKSNNKHKSNVNGLKKKSPKKRENIENELDGNMDEIIPIELNNDNNDNNEDYKDFNFDTYSQQTNVTGARTSNDNRYSNNKKRGSSNIAQKKAKQQQHESVDSLSMDSSNSVTLRLVNKLKSKRSIGTEDELDSDSNANGNDNSYPRENPLLSASKSRGSVGGISRSHQQKLKEFYRKNRNRKSNEDIRSIYKSPKMDELYLPKEILEMSENSNDNEMVITPLHMSNPHDSENDTIPAFKVRKSLPELNIIKNDYGMIDNGDKVCMFDFVKLSNNDEGYVKFMGSIKNRDKAFYIGIELNKPNGKHNGKIKSEPNRQYFLCEHDNTGKFVELQEIIDVVISSEDNEDEQITYGDRVYVYHEDFGDDSPQIGCVKFIGILNNDDGNYDFKNEEIYYGVELDNEKGNSNGIKNGIEYFYCHNNYGIFVKSDDIDLINDDEYDDTTRTATYNNNNNNITNNKTHISHGNKSRSESSVDVSKRENTINSKRRGSKEVSLIVDEHNNISEFDDDDDEKRMINKVMHGFSEESSITSMNKDDDSELMNYITEAHKKINDENITTQQFEEWENQHISIKSRLGKLAALNGTEDEMDSDGDIDDDENDETIDIFLASKLGYFKRVKRIIQSKTVDINRTDISGKTPLIHASLQGHIRVVKELCKGGAHVNYRKNNGESTALSYAVSMKKLKCVRELLMNGADTNVKDGLLGWTPLHDAAKKNFINIAKLLIQYKADVFIKDKYDKTPYDRANDEGNHDMCSMLKMVMDNNGNGNILFNLDSNNTQNEFNTLRKHSFDDTKQSNTPSMSPVIVVKNENDVEIKNISNYNKVSNFDGLKLNDHTGQTTIKLNEEQMKKLIDSGIVTNFNGFDKQTNTLNLTKLTQKDKDKLLSNKVVTNILKSGGIKSNKKIKKVVDVSKEAKKLKGINKAKAQEFQKAIDKTNSNKKKIKIDKSSVESSKNAKSKAKKVFENMQDSKKSKKNGNKLAKHKKKSKSEIPSKKRSNTSSKKLSKASSKKKVQVSSKKSSQKSGKKSSKKPTKTSKRKKTSQISSKKSSKSIKSIKSTKSSKSTKSTAKKKTKSRK